MELLNLQTRYAGIELHADSFDQEGASDPLPPRVRDLYILLWFIWRDNIYCGDLIFGLIGWRPFINWRGDSSGVELDNYGE